MTQFWINSPFRETSKIENFISKLIHENGIRYKTQRYFHSKYRYTLYNGSQSKLGFLL